MGLKPVVVINKVDKPNCRPEEVQEMVFDLMFSLDATEEQPSMAMRGSGSGLDGDATVSPISKPSIPTSPRLIFQNMLAVSP